MWACRRARESVDAAYAEAALTLIDVSNKNSPTIRATENLWTGGTFPTALEVRGTVAYVLTGGVYPGISVIDVGNPDNLYFINSPGEDNDDTYYTTTSPSAIAVSPDWQWAVVVDQGYDDTLTFDTSKVGLARTVTRVPPCTEYNCLGGLNPPAGISNPVAVSLWGTTALVAFKGATDATDAGTLSLIDVSDLSSPAFVRHVENLRAPSSVVVQVVPPFGPLAFVTEESGNALLVAQLNNEPPAPPAPPAPPPRR